MAYGADFATADPANAPLDAPIMLGADPAMVGAGLLLLLAAFLLGWFMGARARSRAGDATASIWKVVDRAAKEAMKADDNALKGRAAQLVDVIDRRLGKTLALVMGHDGLVESVEGLRGALAGRKPDDHHGAGHDHDHGHDHGHDGEGREPDHHGDADAPAASSSIGPVTIVNVIPGAQARADRPKPHDHGPRRDLTAREQTAALRLAVAAFNEHWRHESARVKAMRAALTELSGQDGRRGPDLSHG
ncbi:hypothetical protein [Brevundimonas sp.]|uniref:hypothetical protein n=1 Tax=Brevundimonas sp. TaxID=1871086 RepID=UPI002C82D4CD|nr:hypothetical protein [Brevundimonas sp.]HWQ86323.1 hypothetical protein [Brevundimonas sp.]